MLKRMEPEEWNRTGPQTLGVNRMGVYKTRSGRPPNQEERAMGFSLYEASVPVYVRQLNALSAILEKAAAYAGERKIDPTALIQARLYPDMLPLVTQVQAACNH